MKHVKTYTLVLLFMSLWSCIEEIELKTEEGFESVLVVEAIITDQLITQKVLLSRAYLLEEEGPFPERNAQVSIVDSNNNTYQFQESEPGIYESVTVFAAEPNLDYTLDVITSNGRNYSSNSMQLTEQTGIDDLYLEREFNENNEEGVSIKVNSYDPNGNSKFYRYTYEETYKIIAPSYTPFNLRLVVPENGDFPFFELYLKEENVQICYRTDLSNDIVIENTNVFNEDRVSNFRTRFLNRDNYIISHRYSILVTQYIQTAEGHEFYKSLKEISESESILSETQPGFVNGNVFSVTNKDERVVGFFEVSSTDSKRIYFNYEDLFPGDELPPFIISCNEFAPPEFSQCDPGLICSPLNDSLLSDNVFSSINENPDSSQGGYNIVPSVCGDCTVLGTIMPPDFWEE